MNPRSGLMTCQGSRPVVRLAAGFLSVLLLSAIAAGADVAPGVASAAPASLAIKVADEFKVERIYRVPPAFGSWVCLTLDGRGR